MHISGEKKESSGEESPGTGQPGQETASFFGQSSTREAEDECMKSLRRLHLEPGVAVALAKTDVQRGTLLDGDQVLDIATNVFGIRTKSLDVYQYHVDFHKLFEDGPRAGEKIPLIYQSEENSKLPDYFVREHRELHQKLMNKFIIKFPACFGPDPAIFCYDYAKTLFAIRPIRPERPMELDADETFALIGNKHKVLLTITTPDRNVFNIRDFAATFGENLEESNNSITRFIELATSHSVAEKPGEYVMYENKKSYFMNPEKHGFQLHNLEPPKYLCPGASKTVVCCEGPRQLGAPAIVVDSKKTPFYYPVPCVDVVLQVLGGYGFDKRAYNVLEPMFRKLVCLPIHRPHRVVTIKRLHDQDAHGQSFVDRDGNSCSVFEYFQKKYNVTLQHPGWPLAFYKTRGKEMFLPLEMLKLADNQRCKNITSADIASIVKACAVPPIKKIEEIKNCYNSFGMSDDAVLKNANIAVMSDALTVKARVLQSPQIRYANGNQNPLNGKWRLPKQAKVVKKGKSPQWGAILLKFSRDRRSNLDQYKQFVDRFFAECTSRGMDMRKPANVWEVDCDVKGCLEHVFIEAQANNASFLLIGHPDQEKTLHPEIKFFEFKYRVITQCISTKVIGNVMTRSPLSLENIVSKTNVKLGGLNYEIALPGFAIDDSVLFIGLGMNHPAGGLGGDKRGENVSILGCAANDGEHAGEYFGNFFVQPQFRDEKLSVLDEMLEEILNRFKKNRGYAPSRVVFYRSGCSEGQFQSVLRLEVPVIQHFVKKHAPGAPLTIIIPSKLHANRFFKTYVNGNDRAPDQNIPCGTVIDNNVVHQKFVEFFLNSHSALQGTAKTPKYTIIYSSEVNPNLDMFQRWTNALCYNFQIVTSPTSLPAPVYIANRYAERGRQIYNVKQSLPNGQGLGHAPHDANINKYYALSLQINYSKAHELRGKRVNA